MTKKIIKAYYRPIINYGVHRIRNRDTVHSILSNDLIKSTDRSTAYKV